MGRTFVEEENITSLTPDRNILLNPFQEIK